MASCEICNHSKYQEPRLQLPQFFFLEPKELARKASNEKRK